MADALSRNSMLLFYSQAPDADSQPAKLSTALVSLVSQHITWTSTSWIKLFKAGLSSASHKTYQVAQRRYLTFCTDFALTSLPTSENLFCYFVACLGQQGLAHSSIQTYLSGVRQLQISHGFKDPEISQMPRLCQVLRGVKIEQGKAGKAP